MTPVLKNNMESKTLYKELERSLQRARNITEHERRLRELEQIYERHTAIVRAFAAQYRPNEKLVEIRVDDDDDVPHQLARVLFDLLGQGCDASGCGRGGIVLDVQCGGTRQ